MSEQIEELPSSRKWPIWPLILLTLVFAILFFYILTRQFPVLNSTPGNSSLPFTNYDHPYHFYYSQLTSEVFAERQAFWCYDPTFMAGYPKSLIFPTSSTLAELVAIFWPGNDAFAYRWFVLLCVGLTPVMIGLAAWKASDSYSAGLIATCLAICWSTGWPLTYTTWGMGPFILTSAMSLCGAMYFVDWLNSRHWRLYAIGLCMVCIGTLAHPSTAVTSALVTAPSYFWNLRSWSRSQHLALWAVPLLIALVWSPWWVPTISLSYTLGTTEKGFIHPDVLPRLMELWRITGDDFRHTGESAVIICAVAVASGLFFLKKPARIGLSIGTLLLFLLAYFHAYTPFLWFLQPGRYTQPVYGALIIVTGTSLGPLWSHARRWTRVIWIPILLVGLGFSGFSFVVGAWYRAPLPRNLDPDILKLSVDLQRNCDASGRILFEDCGTSRFGDPFGGTNPSALLPLLAPGQYIGGPYLGTHLKTNFTQVGAVGSDNGGLLFFGRDMRTEPIDLETFKSYAETYNIRWCAVWSRPLVDLANENPHYFRPLSAHGFIWLFELIREGNWAVIGSAEVEAKPDQLIVRNLQPGPTGELILSYHWIHTLRSSVPLEPVYQLDDPVPFIKVQNPPEKFSIHNSLW